jgi:hypothetical protein
MYPMFQQITLPLRFQDNDLNEPKGGEDYHEASRFAYAPGVRIVSLGEAGGVGARTARRFFWRATP